MNEERRLYNASSLGADVVMSQLEQVCSFEYFLRLVGLKHCDVKLSS